MCILVKLGQGSNVLTTNGSRNSQHCFLTEFDAALRCTIFLMSYDHLITVHAQRGLVMITFCHIRLPCLRQRATRRRIDVLKRRKALINRSRRRGLELHPLAWQGTAQVVIVYLAYCSIACCSGSSPTLPIEAGRGCMRCRE